MAFTLGIETPGGVSMDIGLGEQAARPVPTAGEPPIFPTKTIMIVGGLALAAVLLFVLVK